MFLSSIARYLGSVCCEAHVLLVFVHRLGKANIQADWLSHWKQGQTDIWLYSKVCSTINHRYGPHSLGISVRLKTIGCSGALCHGGTARWQSFVDEFMFLLKGKIPYRFSHAACILKPPCVVVHPHVTITRSLLIGRWHGGQTSISSSLKAPLLTVCDCMQSIRSTLPNSKQACSRISRSYFKLSAAEKALSSQSVVRCQLKTHISQWKRYKTRCLNEGRHP